MLVLLVVALATLALYPVIVALNRDTLRLSDALLDSDVDLMRTLGSAVAKRDSDTDAYNYRITICAVRLAQAMRILTAGRGAHFDASILDVFVPLAQELLRECAAAEESYLKRCLADFEGHYISQMNPGR